MLGWLVLVIIVIITKITNNHPGNTYVLTARRSEVNDNLLTAVSS